MLNVDPDFIAVTGMRVVADVLECFDNPVLPFQGWTSTPSLDRNRIQ
jgi:hypothetical protein